MSRAPNGPDQADGEDCNGSILEHGCQLAGFRRSAASGESGRCLYFLCRFSRSSYGTLRRIIVVRRTTMKVTCKECGGSWNSPAAFQHSARHELAFLFRSDRKTEGIAELTRLTKVSLRDAKGIALHISRERGKCHRCGELLDGIWLTDCKRCGAINYDL